jgi:4'-phosphopantetheinyl transferase
MSADADVMIDGVHIWRAALDEAGWPGPERLPAAERERAASILREESRRRWIASRWALRRVLAEYLDEPASAIELEEGEGGKPRLRDGDGIEFNLSHSAGLALVAMTEGREVGVDVELAEPGRDFVALADRALEPDAAAAVREAAPQRRPAVFYRAWTRHEARLKCLGVGLAGPEPEAGGPCALADLKIGQGFAAAVAVAGPKPWPLRCRTLTPT